MQSASIQLFLQDTPFGVTRNSWDIKPNLPEMWKEWLRVGTKNCAFIFFATQPFASELIMSMPKLFRYDIIWQKTTTTGFFNAKKMPLRSHESILVFYRKLPTYNPDKTTGHKRKVSSAHHKRNSSQSGNYGKSKAVGYDSTERYPTSVITFKTDKQTKGIHSTQKPVSLLRYIIRAYSNIGDTVFDGYGGSGSTGEAADLEGRDCIICENDSIIFDKMIKRLGS